MKCNSKPEACSGCYACSTVCPKNCIEMREDEEGFCYPFVDKELCVDCGLCEKVCPILHKKELKGEIRVYAAYSLDDKNRQLSSSGGIFSIIATYVIRQGGIVFGAGFNDDFEVEHYYIEKEEDLHKLQGSKYVQSQIGNSFRQAKQFLDEGKIVFFSGTPCQINGLKSYLAKKYDNLITQDFICHGVPSPKVWRRYVAYLKSTIKEEISEINFRDKYYGWNNYSLGVYFNKSKKKYLGVRFKDIYILGFLYNLFLRPSCYECQFKTETRISDITLADFWGVKGKLSLKDDKGVSLALCHSSKGDDILRKVSDELWIKDISEESDLYRLNSAIRNSAKINPYRKVFFEELDRKPIEQLLRKYTKASFLIWLFRIVKLVWLRVKRICKY